MKRLEQIPGLAFVIKVVRLYFDKRISRASAQLAYYLAMCLFPMLIVISAAVGMIPLEDQLVLDQFIALLPEAAKSLVSDYLGYVQSNQSLTLLVGGIIMTFLASSAAFQGLIDIFYEIFGQRQRKTLWTALFTLALSLLLPLMIYGALLIVLLGDWLLGFVKFLLDVPVLHYGGRLAQWMLPLLATFLVLALLYRLTVPSRNCPRLILPGALVGAVTLVGATRIFSLFMSLSTRYTVIYGSLASVIILLLWLFLCSNIIILGNVFNCLWSRRDK